MIVCQSLQMQIVSRPLLFVETLDSDIECSLRRLDSARLRKALDELQARHHRLRAKFQKSICGKALGALG